MLYIYVHTLFSSKLFVIAAQNDLVSSRILYADRIIGERLDGMKIEDKHNISSIENDHFIIFVLPAYVALQKKFPTFNSLNYSNPSMLCVNFLPRKK